MAQSIPGTQPAPTVVAGRQWVVAKGHPLADDAGSGDHEKPFRTINAAARCAQPGDRVVVHQGIYRERVAPVRGGEGFLDFDGLGQAEPPLGSTGCHLVCRNIISDN